MYTRGYARWVHTPVSMPGGVHTPCGIPGYAHYTPCGIPGYAHYTPVGMLGMNLSTPVGMLEMSLSTPWVYHLGYTPPGILSLSTPPWVYPHPTSSCWESVLSLRVSVWRGDKALGSDWEKGLGERRMSRSGPQECDRWWVTLRRVTPAPRIERTDDRIDEGRTLGKSPM